MRGATWCSGAFGRDFTKAIKGSLPQVNVMITGSTNLENDDGWLKIGASKKVIGGEDNQLAIKGKFQDFTLKASVFQKIVNERERNPSPISFSYLFLS